MSAIIDRSCNDLGIKSLLVTSALAMEGKSTIAANMSLTLARLGHRVLLIDLDLRLPSSHKLFGISNEHGLSDFLSGQIAPGKTPGGMSISKCLVKNTNEPKLKVLTAGPVHPDPTTLLKSKKLGQLLEKCRKTFDYVIIDSPPVNLVSDSVIISQMCDAVLLVVGSEMVSQEQIAWTKHQLNCVNANFLGSILNQYKHSQASYQYYHQGYKGYRSVS